MNIGKNVRLERIFNRNTRRTIIVPMDHGISLGPIEGLENIRDSVTRMVEGGANAGLVHKGLVGCGHRAQGRDFGCIVHLSASTALCPTPNAKVLVTDVEEAVRIGADGVSVHVNLGDESEPTMLRDLGRISKEAYYWGMPLLAMVYARGPKVKDEYDADIVAHCARVGGELGADVVKVVYTGDPDSFLKVTEGCCVPVVIAGGPKLDSVEDLLKMVQESIRAGGAGLSIGRNVFQAKDPVSLLRGLNAVVHEDVPVSEALKLVKYA